MFLRANKRFKYGKEHRYWSVVENRRVAGGRSVQARLKELQKRDKLTRDELLLAIGAAKEKAGRNAHRLVIFHLPASGETTDTFRIELDRRKLKATRRHEGQYLLRSNLTGEDPAELWRNYMNLVRIEARPWVRPK